MSEWTGNEMAVQLEKVELENGNEKWKWKWTWNPCTSLNTKVLT